MLNKEKSKSLSMLNKEIKAVRNSAKNINKVINAGIEPTKKYHIKNNVWVAWYPARNTTGKRYYWGDREITKEAAIKRVGE